jgi:hypothetical protein
MMNSFLTASLDEVIETLTPRAEARSGRVEAHGDGERKKVSDWKITVIFLAVMQFSDVVSAKCVFLSIISAFNWSSLEQRSQNIIIISTSKKCDWSFERLLKNNQNYSDILRI